MAKQNKSIRYCRQKEKFSENTIDSSTDICTREIVEVGRVDRFQTKINMRTTVRWTAHFEPIASNLSLFMKIVKGEE